MPQNNMEFTAETTIHGRPMAVLRDGTKIIVKIYLSPDGKKLRIALPGLKRLTQVSVWFFPNQTGGIIDFTRVDDSIGGES
jgi:hypothetical protein